MKSYHYFFYMLKIIILTLIVLIHFDIIYVNNKYYHLIPVVVPFWAYAEPVALAVLLNDIFIIII